VSQVIVYWRPGCPYCASLRRGLRRIGLPTEEVNIWEDPAAAANVRSFAHGNETVPTVVIGGKPLVNPSVARVVETVQVEAPGLFPDAPATLRAVRRLRRLRLLQWVVVGAIIVASFTADFLGDAGLSWALDGVAVAAYLGFGFVRGG
jgi:mycoredoxin